MLLYASVWKQERSFVWRAWTAYIYLTQSWQWPTLMFSGKTFLGSSCIVSVLNFLLQGRLQQREWTGTMSKSKLWVVYFCWNSIKHRPSWWVGDVETVVVQSDACVVGLGLTQECNLSGAVQWSHFHRRIVYRQPVHQLVCVQRSPITYIQKHKALKVWKGTI